MVMEKAFPQLPTELVKNIEELAGIYRQPGYKKLGESLKFLSSSNASGIWKITDRFFRYGTLSLGDGSITAFSSSASDPATRHTASREGFS